MKTFLRLALTLATGAGLTSAFANPITVNNFSFEQIFGSALPLSCGGGCNYSVGAIPSWTITPGVGADAGQFQTNTHFNSVPDGTTVAYSNNVGGIISQTVAPVVQVGIYYTLQVDLGQRIAADALAFTAGASLFVNGVAYAATGTAPTAGNWSNFTASYLGTLADAGSTITIQLTSAGPQADFDNVRLDSATATPEPAVMGMLGAGLVALSILARRKKTTSPLQ